jgi:UDP-N-acetylmuramate--alanine ligase
MPPGRLRIRDAHLVGIGGAGMRALAELLRGVSCNVTGSDQCLSDHLFWKMHQQGLRVFQGHAETHLPEETDVLIYSPAVPPSNPERRAAERLGVRQLSLSQAIGRIMAGRVGVAVAGTHGKTSTTAMLGHLLDHAGKSPSALVGGELLGRGASGWAGKGELFVVESCEYRAHFLDLAPQHAVILNIEPDHFDCFRTPQEAIDSFHEFASRIPADGTLLVNCDSEAALQAASDARADVQTFGSRAGAEWWLGELRQSNRGSSFRLFHRSKFMGNFDVPLPGRHQVLNALAAIAQACRLGVDPEAIATGLRCFRGVKRRFEQIGLWRGVTLIDDYAHHPTSVRITLRTARDVFRQRRLWCAFQPHQLTRTRALFDEFVRSLAQADTVLISPVFAAREAPSADQQHLSSEMARHVQRLGTPARFVESLDQITATIETEAQPGDVFLILGAGDIEQIGSEFSRRLQRQQAS